ncbi:MAG: flagellar basal body L-ring protein FlgH [Phycisphaerae bacterium]|nr:flagellar basal body L-ring protein FlgH [Phycisphaerae bacterium]
MMHDDQQTVAAPLLRPWVRAGLALALICASATGQSLFEQPPADPSQRVAEQPARAAGAAPSLNEVSLFAVQPPQVRTFQAEDLVTIIVSERSKLDRKQEADSNKDYTNDAALKNFIDLISALELVSEQTTPAKLPKVGITSKNKFSGDASYLREDKLTDRLTAKVLEVKPNGTLILEARRQWTTDEEDQVAVLSGVCRSEDVTDKNTVQSNQLFDLKLVVENRGDLDNTTKKGLIPRIWETIFNF